MFTITIQHMSNEVQLQFTLLYLPLVVGEDNFPDLKRVLFENGRVACDFRSTLSKWSDDSRFSDELQLLYLTRV
ncbi:hypothetical protein TNCV_551311 [Trichonephila clavipes]|nr:hypothetical protein TNCV_551311 [Trichonephila clavipes]